MSPRLSALALPAWLLVLAASCGGSGGNAGPGGASGVSGAGGRGGAAGGDAGSGGGAGPAGAGGTAAAAGAGGGSVGGAGVAGASGRGGAAGGTAGAAGGTAGAAGGTAGAAGSTAGAAGGTAGAAGGTAGAAGGATLPANVTVESMTTSTTATSFSARLTNLGPTTPLISAIKMRYYFVDDSTNRNATPLIASASWKIASPSTTINLASTGGCTALTTYATAPRNSHVDFGCALTSPLGVADTITIAMTIDPAAQTPTNDYSYLPPVSVSQFVANDHMLAIVNGVVVAGAPPP